jgi:hypothetical protein
MSGIETALVQLLLACAPLTELIGTKLYPQDAPQEVDAPYVVYSTSDYDRSLTLSGYEEERRLRVRLDAYGGLAGGAYASAKAIDTAIRECFETFFRGAVGQENVFIEGIFPEGGEDGQEIPFSGEEDPQDFVGSQYLVVWHTQEVIA